MAVGSWQRGQRLKRTTALQERMPARGLGRRGCALVTAARDRRCWRLATGANRPDGVAAVARPRLLPGRALARREVARPCGARGARRGARCGESTHPPRGCCGSCCAGDAAALAIYRAAGDIPRGRDVWHANAMPGPAIYSRQTQQTGCAAGDTRWVLGARARSVKPCCSHQRQVARSLARSRQSVTSPDIQASLPTKKQRNKQHTAVSLPTLLFSIALAGSHLTAANIYTSTAVHDRPRQATHDNTHQHTTGRHHPRQAATTHPSIHPSIQPAQ